MVAVALDGFGNGGLRLSAVRVAAGEGLIGAAAAVGSGIIIPDAEIDARVPNYEAEFLRIRSLLVVPMRFGNEALGVLVLVNRTDERPFASGDLNLIQADMGRWWLPPACYDLIIVFFYLDRELIPILAGGLRPGGLLFQANRNERFLAVRLGFDPAYLLEPGRLRCLAQDAGLEVLYEGESPPGQGYNSEVIARRPG